MYHTLRDFPLAFLLYRLNNIHINISNYIMHILTFVIIDTSQVWDLFNPLHVQRPAAFLCRKSPFGSRERPSHDKLQSCWASAFASHCWACKVCNLMWRSLGLAAGRIFFWHWNEYNIFCGGILGYYLCGLEQQVLRYLIFFFFFLWEQI